MGIKDLLRFLKPYTEPIHIKKYAGKRVNIAPPSLFLILSIFFFKLGISIFFQVGIDAYSWLHKGGMVLICAL